MDMEKKETITLHIVSAQIAELGVTFGQQTVGGKSNEIPAVRELLALLKIEGCMVVADALNCQKETAKAIVDGKADSFCRLLLPRNFHPQSIDHDRQNGIPGVF